MAEQKVNEIGLIEWTVTGDLLHQFRNAKQKEAFCSPPFQTIDGTIWKVTCWPHGDTSPDYCVFRLQCVTLNPQKTRIGVNYSFNIMELDWVCDFADTFTSDGQTPKYRRCAWNAFEVGKLKNLDKMNIKCVVEETMDVGDGNTYFEWKVNNHLMRRWKHSKYRQQFTSPVFNAIGEKWVLAIAPNGRKAEGTAEFVIGCVSNEPDDKELNVCHYIGIDALKYHQINCDGITLLKNKNKAMEWHGSTKGEIIDKIKELNAEYVILFDPNLNDTAKCIVAEAIVPKQYTVHKQAIAQLRDDENAENEAGQIKQQVDEIIARRHEEILQDFFNKYNTERYCQEHHSAMCDIMQELGDDIDADITIAALKYSSMEFRNTSQSLPEIQYYLRYKSTNCLSKITKDLKANRDTHFAKITRIETKKDREIRDIKAADLLDEKAKRIHAKRAAYRIYRNTMHQRNQTLKQWITIFGDACETYRHKLYDEFTNRNRIGNDLKTGIRTKYCKLRESAKLQLEEAMNQSQLTQTDMRAVTLSNVTIEKATQYKAGRCRLLYTIQPSNVMEFVSIGSHNAGHKSPFKRTDIEKESEIAICVQIWEHGSIAKDDVQLVLNMHSEKMMKCIQLQKHSEETIGALQQENANLNEENAAMKAKLEKVALKEVQTFNTPHEIVMDKDRIEKQKEFEDKIQEDEKRLSAWKVDSISIENELTQSEQKDVEFEHETTTRLLNRFMECNTLCDTQRVRMENVMEYFTKLNKMKKILKNESTRCDESENRMRKEYQDLNAKYQSLQAKRSQIQMQWLNALKQINRNIDEENKTNAAKCRAENQYKTAHSEATQWNHLHAKCTKLIKQYQSFDSENAQQMQKMKGMFGTLWNKSMTRWFEWQPQDIINWIKYLQIQNELMLCNEFDFDDVLNEMIKSKMNGLSLPSIDKSDLKTVGIQTLNDRQQIYHKINELMAKYPCQNTGASQSVEGQCQRTNIPNEFICPLTKQIMTDPVKIFDNNTYERAAIEKYLKEHHKSPITGEECDDVDLALPNRTLKEKIKIFVSVNNISLDCIQDNQTYFID